MEIELTNLPVLVHRYVPRYVKVGPPIDPHFNPGAEQIAKQQFGG